MRSRFAIVVILAAALVGWSAQTMPAVVASHFVAGGAADASMPRGEYATFIVVLVVAVPTLLALVGRLSTRLPVRFVNLPNKRYWLAPERQAATLASLGRFGITSAYLTLALLCVIHGLVVYANTQRPPHLAQAPLIGIVALYLVALFLGMLLTMRRFFSARSTR
jgi:hypothetical protein